MLKLEKVAKTRELNAILREKPTLFSYSFMVALSYALFCHLVALCLFQISPFKISYEASILAPVQVASDFLFPDAMQQISLQYEDQDPIPDHLLAPMYIPEQLPALATISFEEKPKMLILPMTHDNPFLAMENEASIWQGFHFLPEDSKHEPLLVQTSGEIADMEVAVKTETFVEILKQLSLKNPSLRRMEPYSFQFAVQIDQKRGEVFWWESQHDEVHAELNRLAIQILESLSFKMESSRFLDRGFIEITITLS